MKEFLQPMGGGLERLQPGTRFALGLFLGFGLAGYAVMVALGFARSGFTPHSIASYYAGAVPGEGKSAGELLDLTHFHLFAMPFYLFVLGHVFLMCRWPGARMRRWIVLLSFAGAACDLAAPWLVLEVSPACAWVKIAGRMLLGPGMLAMTLVPAWEIARAGRRVA